MLSLLLFGVIVLGLSWKQKYLYTQLAKLRSFQTGQVHTLLSGQFTQ